MNNAESILNVFDKSKISTKDVVNYLESVNIKNSQILKVLQKKPSLPGYESLPWVKELKLDKAIAAKLRNRKNLNLVETLRLKETLNEVIGILKKGQKASVKTKKITSIKHYIKSLS